MSLTIIFMALFSGFGAGILAGLFGVGGGTLVVPMLMLQGASIHQAVALSLVYIMFTSLSGSVLYFAKGLLEPATVGLLALSAGLTVYSGVQISRNFSQSQLAWLFAAFMVLVLTMFALKNRLALNEKHPPAQATGWKRHGALIVTGLLAGMIASVLGVGGGLIIVPLLVLLCGEDLRQATSLSLAGVCLIALIGIVQHALFGQLLSGLHQLGLNLLIMTLSGMAGAPVGILLNRKLPEKVLRIGFVSLCLCVMAYMLWKATS